VLVEEREHILGQVSRVDGDRGEAPRLLKPLYEPAALGHALDPRHRLMLSEVERDQRHYRRALAANGRRQCGGPSGTP